jgi:hypothetical protein
VQSAKETTVSDDYAAQAKQLLVESYADYRMLADRIRIMLAAAEAKGRADAFEEAATEAEAMADRFDEVCPEWSEQTLEIHSNVSRSSRGLANIIRKRARAGAKP